MTWEDKEAFGSYFRTFNSEDVAAMICKDKENFLDRDRKIVFSVAEVVTTIRK